MGTKKKMLYFYFSFYIWKQFKNLFKFKSMYIEIFSNLEIKIG